MELLLSHIVVLQVNVATLRLVTVQKIIVINKGLVIMLLVIISQWCVRNGFFLERKTNDNGLGVERKRCSFYGQDFDDIINFLITAPCV